MFGIGASELVVIVIVALIVVGPKKLPDALRAVGKALGQFRRATSDLRREVGYDEVVSEVTKPLRDGMASVQEEMRRVEGDVREGFAVKRIFDDDPYSANKKPAALPEKSAEPYPPPSSSGYLTFETEYPEGGADDYAALPENANVYPEASSGPYAEGAKGAGAASEEKLAGAQPAKGEGTGTA